MIDSIKKFVGSIEKKRQEVQKERNKKYEGTFKGLTELIVKKKQEKSNASQNR